MHKNVLALEMSPLASTSTTVPAAISAVTSISFNDKAGNVGSFANIIDIDSNRGNLVIQYLDENGNTIAPTEIKFGNVNNSFITDKITIAGYRFREVQGSETGKFTQQGQTVSYIYTKNNNDAITLPDPLPAPQSAPILDIGIATTSNHRFKQTISKVINTFNFSKHSF